MKRSRFTEEQIITILREQEAGAKTLDVCRKHGISEATFYKCKAKFGGMDVSDARRLKSLEDENAKLKKLLAEAMLDNAMLKDIASKNGDARGQAGSRGSSLRGARSEPSAGVHRDRHRPELGPLPQAAGGRHGVPGVGCGRWSRFVQRSNVCSENPILRITSATDIPVSTVCSARTICSSVSPSPWQILSQFQGSRLCEKTLPHAGVENMEDVRRAGPRR